MRTKGIIYEKCKSFSLEIIALCNELRDKGEYIMSKQILRSGTSIGANNSEALGAESPQDFIHKAAISLKEANETYYWLDLLFSSNNISKDKYEVLNSQVEELYKMLNASVYTIKQRNGMVALKQSSNQTIKQ